MRQSTPLLLLAVLIRFTNSAPQFISFENGKLGVNFGGYHAGVGIGGLLGGAGGAGGLYAEAGTPTGQLARAGLGGTVSENGGAAGGLYAGATAGGNIKASAGLAGGVTAEHSAGGGYASAQAGNHYAASAMGGESSIEGASGFSLSTKKFIAPAHHIETKPIEKKLLAEVNFDAYNEVQPLPKVSHVDTEVKTHVEKKIVHENVQPVVIKEVYLAPPSTKFVEKEIIRTHYKPRRHHFRKTAFVNGYIGGESDVGIPVVYKTIEPQIQKRVDVAAESSVNAEAAIEGNINGGAGSSHVYTKKVTYQRSPTFFEDIFNIPISTLRAVGSFLGNTAANTNISVQKSASVHTESDSVSPKHDSSLSSSASSSAHVSVETPTASKFIEDIFAIPINTLGAVNTFLQNNVGRKTVEVAEDDSIKEGRIRRGPHGRRKAHKQVVVVEETPVQKEE